jgi:hypothetical protein
MTRHHSGSGLAGGGRLEEAPEAARALSDKPVYLAASERMRACAWPGSRRSETADRNPAAASPRKN